MRRYAKAKDLEVDEALYEKSARDIYTYFYQKSGIEPIVEEIRDVKIDAEDEQPVWQVKWKNSEELTWEPKENLIECIKFTEDWEKQGEEKLKVYLLEKWKSAQPQSRKRKLPSSNGKPAKKNNT